MTADEKQNKLNSLIPQFKAAFAAYLKDKDTDKLKNTLNDLDAKARKLAKDKVKENGVWWRFFRGDTGANTPRSLMHCLEDKGYGNVNIKYYEECMEIAIQPETEMTIYFS